MPTFVITLDGGVVHQFNADVDGGGDFDVTRAVFDAGVEWNPSAEFSVGLSFGAGYDGYDFGGATGFGALDPWDDIRTFQVSVPIRWRFAESWTLFAVPSARWAAERGAALADGFHAGLLVGAAYRVSDTLTIGPGIGVIGQIEDSATVFPILLIDWSITDDLALRTGRGIGATQGPGLTLEWDFAEDWRLIAGARYERLRFRLDDTGVAPAGVGEERSVSFYGAMRYTWAYNSISLVAGVNVDGALVLDDDLGNRITKADYDPAPYVGIVARLRF